MKATQAMAIGLVVVALGGCKSEGTSSWAGTWTGRFTGYATIPDCVHSTAGRIRLVLRQTGSEVTGTVSFPRGGPGGLCGSIDDEFDWSELQQEFPWLVEEASDLTVTGEVSGDTLELGGFELEQESRNEAEGEIDLDRYDADGYFRIELSLGEG